MTTPRRRIGLTITSSGRSVSLEMHGRPPGRVLLELPAFADDIASASGGRVDRSAGTVTLDRVTGWVTVELRRPPGSSGA